MILMIGGHPRSGTTLLQTLCDLHPEMAMTNEFGCFSFLGQSYWQYARNIFDRWRRVQGKWAFDISYADKPKLLKSNNLRFALRHLWRFRQQYREEVTAVSLEATYRAMFPNAQVVGDKWPHYLFRMNEYVQNEDLNRLVIYRDCRDVTSSFLVQARGNWKDADWVHKVNNAEKIAARWVRGVEIMEKHADKLIILQYEALMHEPEKELARVSEAIGVDPAGFPTDMINPGSIGKYKKGLTPEELETVMEVAGQTMERLGYLS
ncbi:sulfotransferase family protein [Candidatus Leptofilum sp.]|uniref:sulfotransferase family protein n=1 Tax=Candidatus Leptofilum sp. TaxID=3241576 RepID=UPI003B5A11A0